MNMKKLLLIAITSLVLISIMSCGKDDATTSSNTFSLQGAGS